MDPNRIKAIQKIKDPTSLKEARKVYGFFSFLRRFIKNFSEKAAPIAEVLKTTVPFHWDKKTIRLPAIT